MLALLSTITGLAAPMGLVIATPLAELLGVWWLFVLVGLLGTGVMVSASTSPHVRALDDESTERDSRGPGAEGHKV